MENSVEEGTELIIPKKHLVKLEAENKLLKSKLELLNKSKTKHKLDMIFTSKIDKALPETPKKQQMSLKPVSEMELVDVSEIDYKPRGNIYFRKIYENCKDEKSLKFWHDCLKNSGSCTEEEVFKFIFS